MSVFSKMEPRASRAHRRLRPMALLVAAFFASSACVQSNQPSASGQPESSAAGGPSSPTGSITLTQIEAPATFHVLSAVDLFAYQDIALMFASLTKLDEKLEPVPELADRWEISPDGLTYTFHINTKAKWQDGVPLTAKDVAFSYKLYASKDIPVTYYSRITSIKGVVDYHAGKTDSIEGVQVVDDQTVRFVLSAPNAAFLATQSKQLGTNEILPEHLLGSLKPTEIEASPFWNNPIGAGPYKFVKYTPNQVLELDAFTDYVLGAPKIAKVFVRIGPQDVLLAQLQRGEVDFAYQIPGSEFDRTKALSNVDVTEVSSTFFRAIYPNELKPYLKDKRVRQAIDYALDRPAIVKSLLLGHGEVVKTPIAAPAWAVNLNVTEYPYDVSKAKQLLAEAGWDPSRKLVIRIGESDQTVVRLAAVIQQYLKAVGVDSEVNQTDFPAIVKDLGSGDYDLALIIHTSSYDPDYTGIWSATTSWPPNGNNFVRYSNPKVDDLLAKGRAAVGVANRKPIYDEYQRIIVDELPQIWLFRQNEINAINKRISNTKFGAGVDPWWNISEWAVR